MKRIMLLIFLSTEFIFAQETKKENKLIGFWQFIPPEKGYDSSFVIFKEKKMLDIFYVIETQKASIPLTTLFTHYGFWDTSYYSGESKPNHISDLKTTGRFIFFYDDLIHDLNKQNKIGYDSLGNLYRPTRSCDWDFTDDGNGIEFNFGPEPDEYKRVDKIPDYVLLSLKKNKEHWPKYLAFLEHKEEIVKVEKSSIYSSPHQLTKMYLIKGDEVEVVEEKEQWLRIRYYGNSATSRKVIEGWIKKSDVEGM